MAYVTVSTQPTRGGVEYSDVLWRHELALVRFCRWFSLYFISTLATNRFIILILSGIKYPHAQHILVAHLSPLLKTLCESEQELTKLCVVCFTFVCVRFARTHTHTHTHQDSDIRNPERKIPAGYSRLEVVAREVRSWILKAVFDDHAKYVICFDFSLSRTSLSLELLSLELNDHSYTTEYYGRKNSLPDFLKQLEIFCISLSGIFTPETPVTSERRQKLRRVVSNRSLYNISVLLWYVSLPLSLSLSLSHTHIHNQGTNTRSGIRTGCVPRVVL